jgi:Tol biopolymer transport system component
MHLDISLDGNVAYLPDLGDERPQLLLVDRSGVGERLVQADLPFRSLSDPRLSPDGTPVVVSANRLQVWVVDIRTETPTLLSESGFYPLWTIDGRDLVYGSTRGRTFDLYRIPADLSRQEEIILDWDQNLRAAEMAPDGTFIFREQIEGKGMDLRTWKDLDDTTTIAPLMEGPDDELSPAVSPDGRWMAYVSNLSGQDEVYVTTFPKPTSRVQASSGGGMGPAWSPDGKELYYTRGNAMIAARVDTQSGFRVLSREELFTGPYLQYRWQRQYDVTPDGEHFVMVLNPPRSVLEIVTNWLPTLRAAIRDGD